LPRFSNINLIMPTYLINASLRNLGEVYLLNLTNTALRALMESDFLLEAARCGVSNKKSVPHAPEKCYKYGPTG
ncbi:MAG: hypothetical protein ACFB8W_13060, partial [Elainellaceae cyanobacterium]